MLTRFAGAKGNFAERPESQSLLPSIREMEGVHLVKSYFSRRRMLQGIGATALSASVPCSSARSSMDARDIASIPGVPRIAIEISRDGTQRSAANVEETAMRRVKQLGVD